jgi:hypothetical protein
VTALVAGEEYSEGIGIIVFDPLSILVIDRRVAHAHLTESIDLDSHRIVFPAGSISTLCSLLSMINQEFHDHLHNEVNP